MIITDDDMTYQELIETSVERGWTKDTSPVYTETHHIKPKCLGGTDDSSNLVELLPQEHYIAHKLLSEENPGNTSLLNAWWYMAHHNGVEVTADEYAELRTKYSSIVSERRTGSKWDSETKKKISESRKGTPRCSKGKLASASNRSKYIFITPTGTYSSAHEASLHSNETLVRAAIHKYSAKHKAGYYRIEKTIKEISSNMKSIKPLHDNVLVKIEQEAEKKSSGGIVLTGDAKKTESFGTVLAAGPEADQVTAGDKVMFNENKLLETKLDDGTVVRLYKVESILGIVS